MCAWYQSACRERFQSTVWSDESGTAGKYGHEWTNGAWKPPRAVASVPPGSCVGWFSKVNWSISL